jgi:hypothetical protein
MQIPDKLKLYVNGPHGMNMGTRGADLKPEYARILGSRFVDDQHIKLFLDGPSAGRTIQNLQDNGFVSVILCSLENYESYQFKGKCVSLLQSNPEELQLISDYLKDINVLLVKVGFPDQGMYKYPRTSMMTLLMEVEEIFEQTPKAGTGQKVFA